MRYYKKKKVNMRVHDVHCDKIERKVAGNAQIFVFKRFITSSLTGYELLSSASLKSLKYHIFHSTNSKTLWLKNLILKLLYKKKVRQLRVCGARASLPAAVWRARRRCAGWGTATRTAPSKRSPTRTHHLQGQRAASWRTRRSWGGK